MSESKQDWYYHATATPDWAKQYQVYPQGSGGTVALVYNGEHAEANAALIAAAPDLLSALVDILSAYHGLTLGQQDTSWEGQFKVKARAAIAKAKGSQ